MKFDKKVMESGMVVTFSLALTLSSVCGTNYGTRTQLSSQAVELAAEPVRYFDRTEGAMAAALAAAEEAIAQKEASQANVVLAKGNSALDNIKGNTSDTSAKEQAQLAGSGEEGTVLLESGISQLEGEALAGKAAVQSEHIEQAQENEAGNAEKSNALKKELGDTEEGNLQQVASSEGAFAQEAVGIQEKGAAQEGEVSKEAVQDGGLSKEQESDSEKEDSQETAVAKVEMLKTENQEVSPWAAKLLPNVEEYLNIRREPSDDAEVAGKLHKGDLAKIEEKGDTWTKVRSGDVEGYVKNEFCVTGLEAEELANEVGTAYAIASTGGVRVRAEASSSEEIDILDVMEEGGKLEVDAEAPKVEGWIAVKTEEGSGYVSADYVDTELELGRAISIEEEMAAIAAEEAERAKQEQAASQGGSMSQRGAVAASYDDLTLLGALIQCEAGGEPYEGQLAVGAVVMNRLRAGYAGSISGVIYQGGQFTPASSGALASVLASGSISGSCMQAAQEAINGASNVGGALNFRRATPGAGGIVIGNHMFF